MLSQECADAISYRRPGAGIYRAELFHFEGNSKQFDWDPLINEFNSMSLFSDKKIIEARIPVASRVTRGSLPWLKSVPTQPGQPTADYFPQTGKVCPQQQMAENPGNAGAHIQVWPVNASQMPRWIDQRLRSANISANQEAEILADRVEGNLLAAVQEIEKLKLLAPEGTVDGSTMSSVVTDSARYNVFEFVDRVLAGDAQAAAKSLRGLENEGTEPIPLLWAITRELRVLIKASELMAGGQKSDWALEKAGVWKKRIPLFRNALKRLQPAHLRMLLRQAGAIDRGIKGMRKLNIWDEEVVTRRLRV